MNPGRSGETAVEYLVIGAGPAGLQLGYFLQRSGRSYLILERDEKPGTFFSTFPRHRKLLSINKRYTGIGQASTKLRWDWNSLLSGANGLSFRDYSESYFPDADDMVNYLEDFACHNRLNIKFGVEAVGVSRESDQFIVVDESGVEYTCKWLIVASGLAQHFQPDIPGIELAETYMDVSVDASDFTDMRVLIIGKGNSAFETAERLIETTAAIHLVSPSSLRLAWQSHHVGDLRAVNNNVLDTYQLKSQNAVIDGEVASISKSKSGKQYDVTIDYRHSPETETITYDRVIACTGFSFDNSILESLGSVSMSHSGRFPQQTSSWESVDIPGLFFAGTLMQVRDYRKSASAFIHGFRYNLRALHRILEYRNHGVAWPYRNASRDPESLSRTVISRVNSTSSLWHQFGVIGDLIVLAEPHSQVKHFESVPVEYIHESDLWGNSDYFVVTLEFGAGHDLKDPFNSARVARDDVQNANESTFLHPVVRRFHKTSMVAEHHVIEDIEAVWGEEEHIKPLTEFFASQLAK